MADNDGVDKSTPKPVSEILRDVQKGLLATDNKALLTQAFEDASCLHNADREFFFGEIIKSYGIYAAAPFGDYAMAKQGRGFLDKPATTPQQIKEESIDRFINAAQEHARRFQVEATPLPSEARVRAAEVAQRVGPHIAADDAPTPIRAPRKPDFKILPF